MAERTLKPMVIAVAAGVVAGVLGTVLVLNRPAPAPEPAAKPATEGKLVGDVAELIADANDLVDEAAEAEEETAAEADEPTTKAEPTATPTPVVTQYIFDAWSNAARQFLLYYPANHIQAGGPQNDPSPLDLDWWASQCRKYLEPYCTLEIDLRQTPEAVAERIGWYEAACCVTDVTITGSDDHGVYAYVTELGTQDTWAYALEFHGLYYVQFNDDGEINDVQLVDNNPSLSPKAY